MRALVLLLILVMVVSASGADTERTDVEDPVVEPYLPEEGGYDGGDLILTDKQRDLLYGDNHRSGFAAYNYADNWRDGIVPYTIREDNYTLSQLKDMKEAMRVWERDTCIRFVERTDEKYYIKIVDNKKGCSSFMGNRRFQDGGQEVNLAVPGCMDIGTYLHEYGHALGLIHEHQRPDRKQYMYYYPQNGKRSAKDDLRQYKRYMVRYFDVPFDLSSTMLYGLHTFSKDRGRKPTFGVENTFLEKHINSNRYRYLLSFGDLKTINKKYKCADRCKEQVDCPEDGFVNERCECITHHSYLRLRCRNNPDYEEWCDEQAYKGDCDPTDDYLQRHCMKSCDFCPVIAPGTSGLEKPKGCVNHYSDDKKCDEWAEKGYCYWYPAFVKTNCRKSCDKKENTCSDKVGICANKLSDKECYRYKNHFLWDYCGSEKDWGAKTRRECPDACGVCPS